PAASIPRASLRTSRRRPRRTSRGTATTGSRCSARSAPRPPAHPCGPCGANREPEPSALHDGRHEPLELTQVATLVHAVAVDAEFGDDRVARVPVATRLRIQPVQVAGTLLELLEDPVLRRVVVVAGVAEQDDRRLRRHLFVVMLVEHLEGMPI